MSQVFTPIRMFAAGLVLAVAGSLVVTAQAAGPEGGGRHHRHHMADGPMGGMHFGRMLDGVNATPEQRAQIRQIFDAARTELRGQRDSARTLHQQMRTLFTQPTVDARAVEAVRAQIAALRDQRSKRMTQAMIDASRVLSAEQRQQIGERMSQRRAMIERHRAERESLERRPK